MGIKDKLEGAISGWILKIGVKKGVKAGVAAILGIIGSAKVAPILAQYGIAVDPSTLEHGLTVLLTGLIATGINYVKVKGKIDWL